MKIQMLHGIVFRVGKVNTPYAPGEIVEVTEAEAKQLIDAIAAAYNVRVDAIIKANSLKNAGVIRVGQKLFIPE